jgi:8-oxo-dGTP pyrophosphatase MutT (NUDIX family)
MNLYDLSTKLNQRLSIALPGDHAHSALRAIPLGNTIPSFSHKLPPRPGGVLILLYQEGNTIRFPLIRRQEYLGAHSGQISLPGGKSEQGEDGIQAALREGEEEIGIDRKRPTVLGTLSNFFVIPSNFIITPVVATLDKEPVFIPDPYEVAKILSGSIDDLVTDDAIKEKEILAAGQFRMMAPHFEIDGEIVWGATAMMLNEFRMILRDIL